MPDIRENQTQNFSFIPRLLGFHIVGLIFPLMFSQLFQNLMRTFLISKIYFHNTSRLSHTRVPYTAKFSETLKRIHHFVEKTRLFAFSFFVVDQQLRMIPDAHIRNKKFSMGFHFWQVGVIFCTVYFLDHAALFCHFYVYCPNIDFFCRGLHPVSDLFFSLRQR